MKKLIAVILVLILTASVLGACSININLTKSTEEPTAAPATLAPVETVSTEAPSASPAVGKVDDYIKTADENTVTFGDGNTNTLRIPEIILDSEDAKAANSDIMEKYGKSVEGKDGTYSLDYDAFLNGTALSVIITARYDGGNSGGACYNFDVTTGKKLDAKALCENAGKDYNDVLDDLMDSLEDYYDEKYGALPENDTEKKKTLSEDNLKAASLYLNGSGDVVAMIDIYAAVGGGHWIAQLEA